MLLVVTGCSQGCSPVLSVVEEKISTTVRWIVTKVALECRSAKREKEEMNRSKVERIGRGAVAYIIWRKGCIKDRRRGMPDEVNCPSTKNGNEAVVGH